MPIIVLIIGFSYMNLLKAGDESMNQSWKWGQGVGLTDGTRPNDPATRQEVMTMLQRFYNLCTDEATDAASWLIAVFSWFSMGEIPSYLLQYAHLLYGGCCVSYYCKSAYENKPKIERHVSERSPTAAGGICEANVLRGGDEV